MVTLIIEGSAGSELTYNLAKDSISIGAASDNDIVVRSPGVAPFHLILQRSGDSVTFLARKRQVAVLNGERRSRGVLRVGDRVRIGTAVLTFKGFGLDRVEVDEESLGKVREQVPTARAISEGKQSNGKTRSELVLYSEPSKLAEARRQMVEIFRIGVRSDPVPQLRTFFDNVFAGRQAMLAWLDEEGQFQPIVSNWTGNVPRLPARTFEELKTPGRFAHIHLKGRELLLYPVEQSPLQSFAFLIVETGSDSLEDDELVLAELSRMLAAHWERVESSGSLYGPWEVAARQSVEEHLPGTSNGLRILRDAVLQAARSSHPVLLCGRRGIGRMTVAALIASLHPTGPLPVQVFQGRLEDEQILRSELFGSGDADGAVGSAVSRAKGGVLVVRDAHLLPVPVQRELAAAIRSDLDSAYGPSVRWMATTDADVLALVNAGTLDVELFNLFHHHLMRVPSLQERREDLPLQIVGLLSTMASEQGKRLRGIELETLNLLLTHPFEGQMTELVAELRRLVSATPDGEMVHGRVPMAGPRDGGALGLPDEVGAGAGLLEQDNLKVVIPGIERIIIDRVLRRTMGNQSKAARVLNLSRGALIAKMKEYEIPDYRYLRRQK